MSQMTCVLLRLEVAMVGGHLSVDCQEKCDWCDDNATVMRRDGKECDFCTNVATFNVARRRERSPVKLAAEILLQWKGWLPRQRLIEVRH